MFTQIKDVSFTLAEMIDSHIWSADLEPTHCDKLLSIMKSHSVGILSVHLQC